MTRAVQIPVLAVLTVTVVSSFGQDGQDPISGVKKQVSAEAARLAEEVAKQKDLEVVQALYSIAAWLAENEDARKALEEKEGGYLKQLHEVKDGKKLTRSALQRVVASAQGWSKRFEQLEKSTQDKARRRYCEVLKTEFSVMADLLGALRRLNDWRTAGGLRAVGWSQPLTYGCMLHARYMALTGEYEHKENQSSEHYSEEGNKAAKAGELHAGVSMVQAVDDHIRTFYHRVDMLCPGLVRIGVGYWAATERYTVLDAINDIERGGIVLYPVDGQTSVPLRFRRENPNPLPDGVTEAGFPITLTFFDDAKDGVDYESVRVTFKDGSGASVEHYFSTPKKPARDSVPDNSSSVCLIPKKPLRPNSVYHVEIVCTVKGEKKLFTAKFTTAPK